MLNNPDFYPTPRRLFRQLVGERFCLDGKILEPSAGKGDLIEHIKEKMGRRDYYDIDAIENDPDLVNTLMGAGYNVVWDDFLTYETYKEYDYIIMNPPFSNGVDHVLKAIDLAEKQISPCHIFAILNKETINNAYSAKRQELLRKLDHYNADIRYVSGAFSGGESQRKSNVEVALLDVLIGKDFGGKSIYESLPLFESDTEESEETASALSTFVKSNEITEKLNDIERMIIEYETACELIKEAFEARMKKSSFINYIDNINKRDSDVTGPFYSVEKDDYSSRNLQTEIDRIRSAYWSLILDTEEFRKHLTSDGRDKLRRQLNAANALEINHANIRTLLIAIGSNREQMLIESIVDMFKRITEYHMNEYSSNIHYYNGWKTNDAYRINKKIIIPTAYGGFDSWDICEDYERIHMRTRDFIDDLMKAFELIDPNIDKEFEWVGDNSFENEVIKFRMFLKGTVHIWFKRTDLLDKLNYICGQHFNWIPGEEEQQANPEAREWVAREFGDIGEVKLLQA